MQKIVLITAFDPKNMVQRVSNNLGPLALEAFISSRTDIKVYVVDTLEEAMDISPDMVGISSVTEEYPRAVRMARELKKKLSVPVIIGGQHITALPLSLDEAFDAGVIGEGEETFLEIVRRYPDLDGINGIVRRVLGNITVAPRRKLIADIDKLPMINWRARVDKPGVPVLMTSRGCLYRCGFCSSPVQWGCCRSYSVKRVEKEIKVIVSAFRPRMIKIFDDIFTLSRKRVNDICGMIEENGFNKEVVFSCMSRVGHFDANIAKALRKANVRFVFFGIESASGRLLKGLKDRPPPAKDIQRTIDIANDAGLHVGCSFIIGAPKETERDILSTLKFIEKNEKALFEIEVNPMVPNPGTEVWHYAMKRGLVLLDMDFGLIRDHSYLMAFDPKRYIYLNEKMTHKKFLGYVERFKEMYRRITLAPSKNLGYVLPKDLPARLKGSARAF